MMQASKELWFIGTSFRRSKFMPILAGGGGGTPMHYLYGYVPPNGVVILKLLI